MDANSCYWFKCIIEIPTDVIDSNACNNPLYINIDEDEDASKKLLD
jgi:hypothetical protein